MKQSGNKKSLKNLSLNKQSSLQSTLERLDFSKQLMPANDLLK